jgi:FMN phosphatase YigB (HAD superfamily)
LGVDAADAVMVGDDARDLEGAKAVGMHTVWKLNGRHDVAPRDDADYAIHDLGELLALPIIPQSPRPVATTESLTPHEDGNADRY